MEGTVKYRLGEIQVTAHASLDFRGVGFNILDEHGAPIVTFGYLDPGDAVKARNLIEGAIAEAKLIASAERS